MRFLVDAQLPPALAVLLREHGHEAQAVREVGLRDANDGDIWNFASQNGMILTTKDEDFAQRVLSGRGAGPAVLWLRVGNCSNRALREWLTPLLSPAVEAIERGERLVEVV